MRADDVYTAELSLDLGSLLAPLLQDHNNAAAKLTIIPIHAHIAGNDTAGISTTSSPLAAVITQCAHQNVLVECIH
eukprot:1022-Heterococcus_DN1.PRE.2